jgi:putative membrane protein
MRRQNIILENIEPEVFIASAALECMTEVQLGRLAMDRGGADSLRHFAHAMIDVYEKANADIARIAARKALPLPNSLDPEHQKVVELMRDKSGRDFDLAYTGGIIEGHERAISLFKRGQRIKDPEISALASRTLSMLEVRLRRTNSLLESTDSEPQSASS